MSLQCELNPVRQNSKLQTTTVTTIASFKLPIFFSKGSILLYMASDKVPMSLKAKSGCLDTWEKAASSFIFLFQTDAGSSEKGNQRFCALEKNGFPSGS